MVCQHTGLPTYSCGHCNGTRPIEKEPFGGQRVDETPRFVKGRDSAEWRGLGVSSGKLGNLQAAACAEDSSKRPHIRTEWGLMQALRTLADLGPALKSAVKDIPSPQVVEAALKSVPPIPEGERPILKLKIGHVGLRARVVRGDDTIPVMDCDTRKSPPRKTTRAVPTTFNYEKPRHARKQTRTMMKDAINPGFARRHFSKKAKG